MGTNEKLKREKATLGLRVRHPLDTFREELKRLCNASTAVGAGRVRGLERDDRRHVEDYRERNTKRAARSRSSSSTIRTAGRGDRALASVEAAREMLASDQPLLVRGVVKAERDGGDDGGGDAQAAMKLLLEDVSPLVQAFRSRTRSVRVSVHVDRLDKPKLVALRRALEAHPGSCPVMVQLVAMGWKVTLQNKLMVELSEAMMMSLERLFGEKVCEQRGADTKAATPGGLRRGMPNPRSYSCVRARSPAAHWRSLQRRRASSCRARRAARRDTSDACSSARWVCPQRLER